MDDSKDEHLLVAGEKFSKTVKESTAMLHLKLEQHNISMSILKKDILLADYAFYLSCMAAIIKAYDTVLLPQLTNVINDVENRYKYEAIAKDLVYLAEKGATVKHLACFELPALPTIEAKMGFAYVIEGSTLGGRYILNHVRKILQVDETNGAAYFAGYVAETGKMWEVFLATFNAFAAASTLKEDIIHGAQAGFESIFNYFEQNN